MLGWGSPISTFYDRRATDLQLSALVTSPVSETFSNWTLNSHNNSVSRICGLCYDCMIKLKHLTSNNYVHLFISTITKNQINLIIQTPSLPKDYTLLCSIPTNLYMFIPLSKKIKQLIVQTFEKNWLNIFLHYKIRKHNSKIKWIIPFFFFFIFKSQHEKQTEIFASKWFLWLFFWRELRVWRGNKCST